MLGPSGAVGRRARVILRANGRAEDGPGEAEYPQRLSLGRGRPYCGPDADPGAERGPITGSEPGCGPDAGLREPNCSAVADESTETDEGPEAGSNRDARTAHSFL